jgi:hypothetical protein
MVRRINQTLSEGVDGNMSELLLADLRGMIWKQIDTDGSFRGLAEKAGVSPQTVSRLMWDSDALRQTKRPHFETVTRLLYALDRLDLLKKAFEGDHQSIKYGQKK